MLGFIISLLPFTFIKDYSFINKKHKYLSIVLYDLLILVLCMVITKDFTLISISKNILGLLLSYKVILDIIDNKIDRSKFNKLLFIFLLYIGGSLLISIVMVSYVKIMGYNIESIPDNIQVVFELLLQIILTIILSIIYRKDLVKDFKEFKKNYTKYLTNSLKIFILADILSIIINLIITKVTGLASSTNENIVQDLIANSPIISLISMGFLAPYVEELVFRKSHYDVFKYNKNLFIIASAVTFGFAHVLSSATTLAEYSFVISYMVLGGALAKCYADSDNFFPGFTIHMLNNVILILISII